MASLTNANNYLETLVGASSDAHSNLWEANFTGGKLTAVNEVLKVRCNKFTPPATSQEGYDVKYITATIKRPRTKVNVTRNFTLEFRVDANYTVYKALLEQQKTTFLPTSSFASSDIYALSQTGSLFDVTINMIDEGLVDTKPTSETMYKFRNCWISGIDAISFSSDSSDPIKVSITINFLQMDDLQSGIKF